MAIDWQRLGTALSGAGAGLQGQGTQWRQGIQQERALQAQQEQQLSEERRRAAAQDLLGLSTLLGQGRTDAAMALMNNRERDIMELGGDSVMTSYLRDLMQAGEYDEAKAFADMALQQAEAAGYIEVPKEEAYTLGPNQQRWQGGRMVAENTREDPEQTAALRTLEGRARAAGLEPGTPQYQQFMAQGGAAPRDSARDQRIEDLMQTFGMSRQEAIRAIESRPMIDDRGNLIRYDPTSDSGQLIDVDVGGQPAPMPTPPRVSQEDLAFDPGKGTGFGASFLGLWNSTLGQLPLMPIARGPEEAAQQLIILERDAINALASSSRPAVVEQSRITQLVPRAMEWSQNPEVARSKMTQFIDLMTNQYVDDMRYTQDRRNPRALREESARRAAEVERIVNRVLTPEAAQQMFQTINRIEGEVGEISQMSDADLLRINPAELTDTQLDAYIQRLSSGGQ